MAAYKVINLDSPIESDYWVDIPVRDPATNKDAVDEKGRILVQRHVTRSIKNEELSTFNTAVETLNTLKVDYSTFKEKVSTKVNNHDSSILTNTNNITTLTDSVANHDLQINALYTKINAIQGIDIDDFKYVTETDIKNIKKNYLPLAGGTVTGSVVFAGSVSSNSPIKANLQGTADRAIGDINGKALTSYIANLKVSGASLTITNGAGKASNYTVDNVNHATNATNATNAINATNANHAKTADSATTISQKVNSSEKTHTNYNTNGTYVPTMNFLSYWNGAYASSGASNLTYCAQGTIIGSNNIGSQSVKHAKSTDSATNANHATIADRATNATNANHASTATKATQDAAGQQINTTYVKDVTTSNATITVTKGNGTTSTDTIDNVSNATNATNLGGYPASNYIRRVNGITPDNQGNVQLGDIGAITGKIEWFAFNKAPNGYLVCNGANVSRKTYAKLFAVIGTTFGSGDGSTTFALPNLIDKFAQGNTTVGTYKSAGLPNITGTIYYMSHSDTSGINNDQPEDGAFRAARFRKIFLASAPMEATRWVDPTFDASLSNPIYGNSTTVQPPALTLLPCIKY